MYLYTVFCQIAENESIQYLSKASQSLGQALNLALKCGNKVVKLDPFEFHKALFNLGDS